MNFDTRFENTGGFGSPIGTYVTIFVPTLEIQSMCQFDVLQLRYLFSAQAQPWSMMTAAAIELDATPRPLSIGSAVYWQKIKNQRPCFSRANAVYVRMATRRHYLFVRRSYIYLLLSSVDQAGHTAAYEACGGRTTGRPSACEPYIVPSLCSLADRCSTFDSLWVGP
jgi:hypothetical protein